MGQYMYNKNYLFIVEAEFPDIVHSLDVWHKSKSIKKCLAKVWYLLDKFILYEMALILLKKC